MKKYTITWELVQTGISEIKAKDLNDAEDKAEGSVTDFGDPKQFIEVSQWDTGWKVKSVEEA